MKKIEVGIYTEFIKLQQILKLAGFIDQGSDARFYINEKKVKVNGVVAIERGKKIRVGDSVELEGIGIIKVIEEEK